MTPNEYQRNAMRTASGISTSCPENLLLQGVMGMAGELIVYVRKDRKENENG